MDEFLERIEFFLTQTGMSATTLGWQALKNPNFVFGLRNGRGCTVSTIKKIRKRKHKKVLKTELEFHLINRRRVFRSAFLLTKKKGNKKMNKRIRRKISERNFNR